ncbi:MAG: aldehyde dehydrogenase family protein [Bacteroidia bacterium]
MQKISFPIYLAGQFSESDKKLEVLNPYNHSLVGNTWLANEYQINKAIEIAINSQKELEKLPSYKRYEILSFIASEIKKQREEFALLLSREAAKPLKYALAEIDRSIQTFTIAAEESKRLPKEYISLDWTPIGEKKEGLIKHFPIGLVAGITPFNFPLNLAVHKIAPAIAAGCPIIIKPASATPLSCLKLAQIIDKSELPKGAFSVLPADRTIGDMLVTDERIKLLSFTGSPAVGWKMKKNAGKKKVVLELGGNAGLIITPSADLNKAIEKALTGAFSYAGQVCIHTQRIFVHSDIMQDFINAFVAKTKALKNGPPDDINTDITSMIDEVNAIRVESWINEAINNGAKLLCGGKRNGAFVEPTVLTNTQHAMKVRCEEVFGPVVTIDAYNTFEEAIHKINEGEFGLQAGVFTNSIEEMNYAFQHIEAGGVIINDVPTLRLDHMPYGGVKNSGLGREGVKYAIMDMMEPKILVKDF